MQIVSVTSVGEIEMDKVILSEFEKVKDDGNVQVYFKELMHVDGISYNYDAVFGKSNDEPYKKFPLVKGMIFVIDKHSTLHEKWWNEKGYHNTDVVCNLPRYKYFIATISIFRYSVPDALTNIGSLEPFFGDIEN